MKIICVLVSCFALATAQYEDAGDFEIDYFQAFERGMSQAISYWNGLIKESMLNDDMTAFNSSIIGMLAMVEPHICPAQQTGKCKPDENWMLGCNCRNGFKRLGECRAKPCQLFTHFKNKGAEGLAKFVKAESYTERYSVVFEYFANPISRALCECPGLLDASINCVTNYDGQLFTLLGGDRTGFDHVVKNFNWRSLKTIFKSYMDVGCAQKDGKDCITELAKMYSIAGTFLDNTFSSRDTCLSMIRFEDEFVTYLQTVASFNMTTESISSIANRFIDAYLELQQEAICEPSCAGEVADAFYSCCAKDAFEAMASKPVAKAYGKLWASIWPLIAENSERKRPNFSEAFKKYTAFLDLNSFCGARTDVYKVRNDRCDALEA